MNINFFCFRLPYPVKLNIINLGDTMYQQKYKQNSRLITSQRGITSSFTDILKDRERYVAYCCFLRYCFKDFCNVVMIFKIISLVFFCIKKNYFRFSSLGQLTIFQLLKKKKKRFA